MHRTFWERFRYLAIYKCRECQNTQVAARPSSFHLGLCCRCPKCGTYRVVRLKQRDHIDFMHTGLLNALERLAGGRLHHCRYCRLQFYDRRRHLASEVPGTPPADQEPVAAGQDAGSET